MNPDPNQSQPSAPAPEAPQGFAPLTPTPIAPEPVPATTVYAAAPTVEPVPTPVAFAPSTPNPFGGAPFSPIAVTPVAPTPFGVQPVGAPVVPGTPLSSNKKKKLIILISSIVGGLLILGVIAFVLFSIFTVSKKDYSDATSQFNEVSAAASTLDTAGIAVQFDTDSSTTDTKLNNDVSTVQDSITKLQAANSKLATMKAVKLGGGKSLYATFNTKITAYTSYIQDYITSVKSYHPAAIACGDDSASASAAEAQAKIAACVAALNGATDLPNPDIKTYVAALLTQYKSAQSIATQIVALQDPYGDDYTQYSALEDQLSTVENTISSAYTDFSSNATKHATDVDPSDAANALGDYLVKQEG
jgi:hypothetical protein